MRTVYATQFKVIPRGGESLSGVAQAVMTHITNWVGDRYRRDGISVAIEFDGKPQELKPNHRVMGSAEVIEDHALISLDWSYPHEPDQSLLWQTQIVLAVSQGEIEVAVSVRITSVRFAVQPIEYGLGRPRLIPALLNSFSCMAGPIALAGKPIPLEAADVRKFVEDILLSRDRSVPVVLVSPVVWTDQTIVDAGAMQDALAGLAVVAELKTKWSGFELTNAVGRLYSCYNGAVRIYWPGLKLDANDSIDHHVFLPGEIRMNMEKGRPLDSRLFRMFAGLGAFRFTEGRVIGRARAAIETSRRARFDAAIQQAKAEGGVVDKELLEFALSENEQLEKGKQQDKKRISELEDDLANYKASLAGLYGQEQQTVVESQVVDVEDSAPERVLDALTKVAEKCGDILVIYKSALESAKKSDFARPEEVMKALLAIADVGRKYFESKKKKHSMGPWEGHFESHGLKYKSTDSEMTLNMFGKERKFTHDGQKTQMFKHIRLGKGDRKNCLQIYFEPNDKTKRIEIGYCGRHLQHYSQTT